MTRARITYLIEFYTRFIWTLVTFAFVVLALWMIVGITEDEFGRTFMRICGMPVLGIAGVLFVDSVGN